MTSQILLLLLTSVLLSQGASQTTGRYTTAPPAIAEQPPPTRTVYGNTIEFNTAFACAGKSLTQATAKTYPDSAYTTTVSSEDALSTSFHCCTETIGRKHPHTVNISTTYLTTVTSTSSIVCGGCEITVLDRVYPDFESYTATVTSPTTTLLDYTCTSRTLTFVFKRNDNDIEVDDYYKGYHDEDFHLQDAYYDQEIDND
ncbi:MAG: hypothetical protein MMC23_005482 [Stictis urceolatum]|nr:hypothetical protein [Stictis urceolata]